MAQKMKRQKVNLNNASKDELGRVKSIGPDRAAKIVQYREQHGRINSVDDLRNVQGFAEERIQQMRNDTIV